MTLSWREATPWSGECACAGGCQSASVYGRYGIAAMGARACLRSHVRDTRSVRVEKPLPQRAKDASMSSLHAPPTRTPACLLPAPRLTDDWGFKDHWSRQDGCDAYRAYLRNRITRDVGLFRGKITEYDVSDALLAARALRAAMMMPDARGWSMRTHAAHTWLVAHASVFRSAPSPPLQP